MVPHISIPGSKSYTNRALIMAALTRGPITITNHLMSDDIEAMISCLRALGILITIGSTSITVENSIFDLADADPKRETVLDCRQSGTTYRFLIPVACMVPGVHHIRGEKRLTQRPIKDLIVALQQIGYRIEYLHDEDQCQRITVYGTSRSTHDPKQGSISLQSRIAIPGTISSQYISALLMAAPLLPHGLHIDIIGTLISKPYVDMTTSMMSDWGISVKNTNHTSLYVPSSPYSLPQMMYRVEGDYSAAGYFFAIAALNKTELIVENLNRVSQQGDKKFMDFLIGEKFISCSAGRDPGSMTVCGEGIHPVTVNMEDFPDQAQTLAVLVACAPGTSTLTGVRSLRLKETERVIAIQTELAKMGTQTDSPDEDTLIIYGGTPHAAEIDTYKDHRMAMSFSIAKTMLPDLVIHHPEVVSKTFPDFWDQWQKCIS